MMAVKIVLLCLIPCILGYFLGAWLIEERFEKEVGSMYAVAAVEQQKTLWYAQLTGLPKPVQSYFRHVLREGQPYITSLKLTHDGQFKTDLKKNWTPIRGTEYFSAPIPGFVWKGSTSLFTARDMYISGQGRLVVSLFSLFTVQDAAGEKYNEGELLRWLTESVIFPTNLLPSENLRWLPQAGNAACIQYSYNHIVLNCTVIFNAKHEITELRTMRNQGDGPRQQWINKLSDYQKIKGIWIPTMLEAGWQLTDGYFPYARFRIREIEYNALDHYKLSEKNS